MVTIFRYNLKVLIPTITKETSTEKESSHCGKYWNLPSFAMSDIVTRCSFLPCSISHYLILAYLVFIRVHFFGDILIDPILTHAILSSSTCINMKPSLS